MRKRKIAATFEDVNVDRINGDDDRTIDIIVGLDGKSASIKN
jgi:hypothetical protein